MRLLVLAALSVVVFAGEVSQEEQDRIWREAMKQSAAAPTKSSEPSAPTPTYYDALAAQRHAEALARDRDARAEAARRRDAEAAERAAKSPKAATWAVPQGDPAADIPQWARGEWTWQGAPWVIGAKSVGIDGQAPIAVRSVVDGGSWCCVELDTSTGLGRPRFAVMRSGVELAMGAVASVPNIPDAVESWAPLVAR